MKNEDIIRQRTTEIKMNIKKSYPERAEWSDEFRRMIYQRAFVFIIETPIIAQQLFSSQLSAIEFLTQVSSWWNERREPRPVNEQQVQNLVPSDNPQELQASVSLTQTGNGQAAVNDDKIESVVSRQSGPLYVARETRVVEERADASYSPVEPATSHAVASAVQQQPSLYSTPFEQSNGLNPEGSTKPTKSYDVPDSPSVPGIVPKEPNSLSQDSTGDIPNHRPTSSLAEVILHPVVPSALIMNSVGKDRISQFAENQSIEAVHLNNSVVATVNTNVKVDQSDNPDGSLSTTSSSSDEVSSISSPKKGLLQRIFGS